jgi:prefoldin subunit 5
VTPDEGGTKVEQNDDIAERLDQEVEDLQRASDELKEEIDDTRKDWEAKEHDASVPGAQPADDGEDNRSSDTDSTT